MKLIRFENYKLTISEEAMYVKSFYDVWLRDKTEDKTRAIPEFGYLYNQFDPRSDYMFITDEEERFEKIKEQEGLPTTWKPDKLLLKAATDYKYLVQTTASLLLEDTRFTVDKVRAFLRGVDLFAVDEKDKPKYTINSITSTLSMLPDMVKKIADAEREVAKEIVENSRMRGQKTKKIFEDGM